MKVLLNCMIGKYYSNSLSTFKSTISDIEIWDTYIEILFLNTIVQNSKDSPSPPPFQYCYICQKLHWEHNTKQQNSTL